MNTILDPKSLLPHQELVRLAVAGDVDARLFLRREIEGLAGYIANLYAEHGEDRDTLVEAGMTYFDQALDNYGKRLADPKRREEKEPYRFSTYFSWWISRSIETYLGITDEPLRGVTPRDADQSAESGV